MDKTGLVKELRERTQAGMKDCLDALNESNSDIEKAVDIIKAKGQNIVASRQSKIPTEGVIRIVNSPNMIHLLEINCQTDFVARSDLFETFVDSCCKSINDPTVNLTLSTEEVISKTKENCKLRRTSCLTGSNLFSYLHGDKIGVIVSMNVEDSVLGEELAMQIAATNPLAVRREEVSPYELERQRCIFQEQAKQSGKKPEFWEKIVSGKFDKWFNQVCLLEQDSIIHEGKKVKDLVSDQNIKFVRFEVGEGLEKSN